MSYVQSVLAGDLCIVVKDLKDRDNVLHRHHRWSQCRGKLLQIVNWGACIILGLKCEFQNANITTADLLARVVFFFDALNSLFRLRIFLTFSID